MEVGAGIPYATFLRAIGPSRGKPRSCSRRAAPRHGRYGDNPTGCSTIHFKWC